MMKFVLLLMIVLIVSTEGRPSSWYDTDGNYAFEDRQFSNFLDSLGSHHQNIWFDEFLDDDYDLFEFPETPSFPEVQAYGSKHGPANEKREESLGQFLDDVFGVDDSQEYPEKAKQLVPFVQKVCEDAKSTATKIAKVEYEKALMEASSNDGDIEDIVRREFSAFEPENEVHQHWIPRTTTSAPGRSIDDILNELFPGGGTTESSLDTLFRDHKTEPSPTDVYAMTSTPKSNSRSVDDILNELFTPTENTKEVDDDHPENVEDIVKETFAAFEPVVRPYEMRSPWEREMHELFASGERHDMEGSDTKKLWSKSRYPSYHNNRDVGTVKVSGGDIDDIMNELFNTPGRDTEPTGSTTPESDETPEYHFSSTSTPFTLPTTSDRRTPADVSDEDNAFFEAWKKDIQEAFESHENEFQFPSHFVEGDNSLDAPPNLQLIPTEMDTFHLMSVSDPCTGHGLIDDLDHLSKLLSTYIGRESDVEGQNGRTEDVAPNAETEWISHPRSTLNLPLHSSKYDKYFKKHDRSKRHQGTALSSV